VVASKQSYYELIRDFKAQFASKTLSKSVFGPTPPNIFVGREGYPNVFVGPMVSLDAEADAKTFDSPAQWTNLTYEQIISFRSSLARGMRKQHVKKNAGEMQLAVLSQKPVDIEVEFKKPLSYAMNFSAFTAPMGPSGEFESMRLAENPVIPKKIDEFADEKIKVRDAIPELSRSFDYYYLQKLLSAGILGENKKLVPTRWSITAMDRILADDCITQVKQSPELDEISVFSNMNFDNHYEILLLPGAWEFEQFEAWSPGSYWQTQANVAHEYEPYAGRSDYAESEGGGYYAGRLACAEALSKMRRQARVVVFREIDEAYKVPLGVWQVREGVRNAFTKPPMKFNTLAEALNHLRTRLRVPLEQYLEKSSILRQKKMTEFV